MATAKSHWFGRLGYQLAFLLGAATMSLSAQATPRDVAYRIFNRLNGVPPSAATLDQLEAMVAGGDLKGAALAAINDSSGRFYNTTVRNFAARWSNADKTPRVALNDMIATVIGMTRDEVDFSTVLSADIVYTGNAAGAPAYSLASNDHYLALETSGAALHTVLTKQQQTAVSGLPAEAVAGLASSRGFGEAYYKAGTNRRAFAFTMENFLCKTMDQLSDTTRPDVRIRRDVTRAPGGDTALFRNKCAGCHAGMDGLAGAYAYYDWDDTNNALIYTPGVVGAKMNRNATEFPDGYVTTDNGWVNMWLEGQNKGINWGGAASGNGLASMGEVITGSEAFAGCMVRQTFETVCLRQPMGSDQTAVDTLTQSFKAGGYSMKQLFAETAASCLTQ